MTDSATDTTRNTPSERELRSPVAERATAVHTRDATILAARPTDDVITFDVLALLNSRGNAAVAEHMLRWFDFSAAAARSAAVLAALVRS